MLQPGISELTSADCAVHNEAAAAALESLAQHAVAQCIQTAVQPHLCLVAITW